MLLRRAGPLLAPTISRTVNFTEISIVKRHIPGRFLPTFCGKLSQFVSAGRGPRHAVEQATHELDEKSLRPRHLPDVIGQRKGLQAVAHLAEEARRQEIIDHRAGAGTIMEGANIWPRPSEAVGFVEYDPRAGCVEAEAALGAGRKLDCRGRVNRRAVRDRQDDEAMLAIRLRQ